MITTSGKWPVLLITPQLRFKTNPVRGGNVQRSGPYNTNHRCLWSADHSQVCLLQPGDSRLSLSTKLLGRGPPHTAQKLEA